MYRGHLSVRKISILALNLPRGAQTWVALGGAAAITAETDALWMVEHALYKIAHAQNGAKGKAPERRPYPPGALEAAAKAAKATQQAEAFRAKHSKP
jgi:uncharacterized protein YceH (UPF0502 family)